MTIYADILGQHPTPFQWSPLAEDRNLPLTKVSGQIDHVGLQFSQFTRVFEGTTPPPHFLQHIRLGNRAEEVETRLAEEVDKYGTVVLHMVGRDRGKFPQILAFGSLGGYSAILECYHALPSTNVWDLLRRNHPHLHRLLTDGKVCRLTTSYSVLHPFLAEFAGHDAAHDLHDAILAGSLVRRRDFTTFDLAGPPSETMTLQVLVWSFLGNQYGPAPTPSSWSRHMADPDAPWPAERRHLHRFTAGQPPSSPQDRWIYQVLRAGGIGYVVAGQQGLHEHEMDLDAVQTGISLRSGYRRLRNKNRIHCRHFQAHLESQRKAPAKGAARPSTPAPKPASAAPTSTAPASPPARESNNNRGRLADIKSRMHLRNAPLVPATPPRGRNKKSRPQSQNRSPASASSKKHAKATSTVTSGAERSSRSENRRRSRRTPDRSSSEEPTSRSRPSTSSGSSKKRACSTAGCAKEAKFIRLADDEQRARLARQSHLDAHPPSGIGPLGPRFCQSCGVEPPHINPEDCIVVQYVTRRVRAKKGLIPCSPCGAKRHTSRACPFLHMKCSTCLFRGHAPFECATRTPVQWLAHYLLHFKAGRLTRSNRGGPIHGEFGFGDISGLDIPPSLKTLIDAQTRSLADLQASEPDEFDVETSLTAAWMLLIQEQTKHQERVERDSERLQRDLVRRVALALSQAGGAEGTGHDSSSSSSSSASEDSDSGPARAPRSEPMDVAAAVPEVVVTTPPEDAAAAADATNMDAES